MYAKIEIEQSKIKDLTKKIKLLKKEKKSINAVSKSIASSFGRLENLKLDIVSEIENLVHALANISFLVAG